MAFTREALEFLFENRLQNSREWYEEHKSTYRRCVVDPMAHLVMDLTPEMLEIDDQFICEPKIGKSISRIRRDTRFSRDKSLYRDSVWCCFFRDKHAYEGFPSYFFEFTPNIIRWGCGCYNTPPAAAQEIRSLILSNDKTAVNALNVFEKQDAFYLEGERYKKSKFPDAEPRLQKWLDFKSICLMHECTDFDLLFSENLACRLIKDFKTAAPIYELFLKAHQNTRKE